VRVTFGEWLFDGEGRQLLRSSWAVAVSPKAFDLLAVLIDRRPAAVSKAQLKDALWPSTFVADANLPSLVAEIRAALGDDARQPRFVRTVQRFGYAFCAEAAMLPAVRAVPVDLPVFHLVGAGHDVALPQGETILGRARWASVAFDSTSVSRQHARIVVTGGQATIEDMKSKNGTFVDGQRTTGRTALHDGHEVRLGSVRLTFRAREDSSTATVG
jgi:DNA-binding winged helix-turn-helix (wHTH) protein